jgi:hypothetical protein
MFCLLATPTEDGLLGLIPAYSKTKPSRVTQFDTSMSAGQVLNHHP